MLMAFVHSDDLAKTTEKWEEARRQGALYEIEDRTLRRDGQYRWFLVRAWPMLDGEGNIIRWFGTNTVHKRGSGDMTFGLFSIDGRLMYTGGHMEVESGPGKGIRITLWVPADDVRADLRMADKAQPKVPAVRETQSLPVYGESTIDLSINAYLKIGILAP